MLTDEGAAGSLGAHGDGKGHGVCVCHPFRIGVLCAYAANQNLSSQVKNIRRLVNSNMRDLHTFANDTPMVRQSYSMEQVDGDMKTGCQYKLYSFICYFG